MDIVSKINGNTLSATEFNQIPTELEAGITASGQTPSDAILNQVPIFVSRFAANNFYIDSGAANAYVLTLAASMTNPVSVVVGQGYFVGMTIRFRAGNANTGASTVNVNSAGVKNLKKEDGTTDLAAGDIPTTQDSVFRYDGTSFVLANDSKVSGDIVQVVNTQTGAVATGTTLIPADDTIPQNTEGTEFMTLAITPKNASNKLRIDVSIGAANNSVDTSITAALFQDSTANALAASTVSSVLNTRSYPIYFTYFMTAGTTSSTTFKVRMGSNNAGTVTFNGQNTARLNGGVSASSITITEIKA